MSYPNDSRPPEPNHHPPYPPHNGQPDDPWGQDTDVQRERQHLAQEAARHTKARKATVLDKFIQAVIFLVSALELLLSLRFMLRLMGANPENAFAGFVYNISQPFVEPFSTLFISPTFNGSTNIFDVNLLVAMAVYLILLALFLGLARIFVDQ